jgi:ribosomal protein L3 glutamine methyltransferase
MITDTQLQSAVAELHTLQDFIRWGASQLAASDVYFGHGTDTPWDDALVLVSHALHLPWNMPSEWRTSRLTTEERTQVASLLQKRINERIPTPYLTGEAWFCEQPYWVDERVLIPRSPIAELIKQRFAPHLPTERQPQRILDLCCGSGCIGLACAYEFDQAQVELLDLSFDALEVAEANIERHRMQDRVVALQSDLFAAAEGRYDIIVSNPPYVDADDMACLPAEYHHEPEMALAAGDDGLDLVRIMLAQARRHLNDDGILVVEVGNSWPALAEAYPDVAFDWQDFERGGHGVFVLHASQLDALATTE